MAGISIEGGCIKLSEDTYIYNYADELGAHTLVFFTSGAVPKIGDSIVDGILVPLEGYKINPDTSKWIKIPDETWGL